MTRHHARPAPAWTIIIPVKDTSVAKTRLRGFDQPARAALALAFVLDAATAVLGCLEVRRVMTVTNDQAAARALGALGVEVIADIPDAGLNPAVVHGVTVLREREPAAAVAAMLGDLPALRADDLSVAIGGADELPRWFVADADGLGTTLLAAGPSAPIRPAFGSRSRARHRDLGAIELAVPGLDRLRRDVDTEVDLREAIRLGVGANTLAALAKLDVIGGPTEVA